MPWRWPRRARTCAPRHPLSTANRRPHWRPRSTSSPARNCSSASGTSDQGPRRAGPGGRKRRRPVLHSAPMTKNLVIVESPAKARTIERYLGPGYRVLASYGHVRDLPENPGKNKLGVDVEHGFAPDYVVSDDRRKQVATIAKAASEADAVYLATDLDREGEAIAWHVTEAAHVPSGKTHRVTFSEITE